MSFAAPIARDGFLYNGDLFVEVGDLNRHKRASVPELTAVLRPDLKQSKATALQTKDPVGHWYEAQLIHYGLQPSKTKAVAKVRLLEALNKGALHIPQAIARLEESLRKEFNAAEKKARAQHKASKAEGPNRGNISAGGTVKSKKRKNSDSMNVNVNVVVGSFMQQEQYVGFSEPTAAGSPAKKPKMSLAKKAPTTKVSSTTAASRSAGPEVTASKTPKQAMGKDAATKPQSARKLVAVTSTNAKKAPTVKKEPAIKSQSSITPTVKKESKIKTTTMKQEPTIKKDSISKGLTTVKKEPPHPETPNIKAEPFPAPTIFPSSSPTNPPANPTLGLLNGHYAITCPAITHNFPTPSFSLALTLTLDTPRLWGTFNFGPFSGIILLPQRPFSVPETIWFTWRGSDGEGVRFGDDCRGYVSFLGGGRIRGAIKLYGECEFWGARDGVERREVRGLREEWDGFCEENGRERWG